MRMTTLSRSDFAAAVAAAAADPEAIRAALPADTAPPDAVSSWLRRLRLLYGVPFNYLVPDERMLPPESLRFFYLDLNWLDALLDGAFSIGRNLSDADESFTLNLDRALLPPVAARAAASAGVVRAAALGLEAGEAGFETVSGFVMRSSLVSAYPGMGVSVYPRGRTPDDPSPHALTLLRLETLGAGSDTLLCLADGDAYRVDIHEAAEHLHYGLDDYAYDASAGRVTATKQVRTFTRSGSRVTIDKGRAPVPVAAGGCFRAAAPRTLRVGALASLIAAPSGLPALDSAEMGFEMTEGVGMVSFVKRSPSS